MQNWIPLFSCLQLNFDNDSKVSHYKQITIVHEYIKCYILHKNFMWQNMTSY